MEKISLLSFIKQEQILNDYWYDCLRYELDKHVYYYGNHYKRSLETVQSNKIEKVKFDLKIAAAKLKVKPSVKIVDKSNPVIISNAYFNFNAELSKAGFTVIQPPWAVDRSDWKYYDADILSLCLKIKRLFEFAEFNYLISKEFIQLLEKFCSLFKSFISKKNIRSLVVPNDEGFFGNISIKIFKELKLPTFIFLHGLPGRYNSIDENRSDFLIVWGKKMKEIYMQNGMTKDKIFVSGHPKYQKQNKKTIEFSLSNILVLTKTIPGSPHSTGVVLSDRGNLIVYLLSIQKILKKVGVKNVRLRPHPSENINWYMKFLDRNFFIRDTNNLTQSLNETSLIIGPISSVFLEAMYYKINYLVYEPVINNTNILNNTIVPPFDGSDSRIAVAYNEETLFNFLKSEKCADDSILTDYLQMPFDVSFIKPLIQ
ncbi:MAG: hypothetical protein ABJA35_02005 [Parafilimonas sp.]